MAAKTEADVSEDFLRNYVARGGKVVDNESGKEITPENVEEELKEAGGGDKEQPESRKELSKRAAKAAPDPEAEAKKKAKEEEKARLQAEKEAEQARIEAEKKKALKVQTIKGLVTGGADNVVSTVQPIADRISNLSTVGGIALLLVILTILLFVLVQVNAAGDTRLKLLWAMLNGQTKLQGRVVPTAAGETATPVPGTKKGGPPIVQGTTPAGTKKGGPPTTQTTAPASNGSNGNAQPPTSSQLAPLVVSSYRGFTF